MRIEIGSRSASYPAALLADKNGAEEDAQRETGRLFTLGTITSQ